jgi:nitronate monooxygenase
MSNKQPLRLPVIQAPMFLISGPEMVIASCKAGVIGSFPTPNARTIEDLEQWLITITEALKGNANAAPWAMNVIMHRSYTRRDKELALAVKYQAPIVISALGSPKDAVGKVHAYGGKMYADVISPTQARKAAQSGVDGLVLVCAGAGGHTGQLSPFAFIEEVRQFWHGDIIVGGGISSGQAVLAAQVMGADYAYLGTRFITTNESMAQDEYKQMIVDSSGDDIVCSDSITGVKANWLKNSLINGGYDIANMPDASAIDFLKAAGDAKRWKDIWAAGQGVGAISNITSIANLVDELEREYNTALTEVRNV